MPRPYRRRSSPRSARLQRVCPCVQEVSADPGGPGLLKFGPVTRPDIRMVVICPGIPAFTLSFDEIPVTLIAAGRADTSAMFIQFPCAAARFRK